MKEWKEYLLEDVGKITTGKTPRTAVKEYFDGTIPFVTPADINTPYKYITETGRYLTEEGLNSIINNSIDKGSICVSCIGNIGYTGIVQKKCASNQQINSITVNKEHNRDFIYYAIKNLWSYFKNYEGQSTTVSILNKGQFAKIPIKCPPLLVQQKIAFILSSLDDKIEVNRRINDNLEQQAQALFKSWFVDFEPFRDKPFVESVLGMIPEGWRVGTLEDITTQKNEKAKVNEGIKVLSPVTTGNLLLSEDYFTKQVYSESIAKYKIVENGDFAYNPARINIGSIGRNNYPFTGCVSPVYVVFKCKNGYSNFFDLYRKTEKFKTEVKSKAIGGVRQTLNYRDFAMIQSIIAPSNVVIQFDAIYSNFRSLQIHLEKENLTLAELRDTLLPRLMSGELEIQDIEESL